MEYYIAIKKKWSNDTRYYMDEPWKHYVKWKKLITKNHILWDSIFYEMSRIGKSIDRNLKTEGKLMIVSKWVGEELIVTTDMELIFGIMEMFWN